MPGAATREGDTREKLCWQRKLSLHEKEAHWLKRAVQPLHHREGDGGIASTRCRSLFMGPDPRALEGPEGEAQ
eukprot:1158084-Pelagomonas_calceolata.AAC.2